MNQLINLPDGYTLFTSPHEYVVGMEVIWLDLVAPNWQQGYLIQLPMLQEFIAAGKVAYQTLTPDMIQGDQAWWDSEKGYWRDENGYGTLVGADGVLYCGSHTLNRNAIKHPWLLEATVYNLFGVDLSEYRTEHFNQPQV